MMKLMRVRKLRRFKWIINLMRRSQIQVNLLRNQLIMSWHLGNINVLYPKILILMQLKKSHKMSKIG